MWKKTLLALVLASNYASATTLESSKNYTEAELKQLKNDWLNIYQKELQYAEQLQIKQRQNFQQVMNLIDIVLSQKSLPFQTEQVIQRLLSTLSGYPLEMEADWALLNAKNSLKQLKESDIQMFLAKYPNSLYKSRLQQSGFERLYQEQKFAELIAYAKEIKPSSVADKCRLFSAQYEVLASQAQINPEASQAEGVKDDNPELATLVKEFDDFWLTTPKLTSDCANLENYWRDQGLKTDEKVRLKAVELVKQNANAEITNLAINVTDETLKNWLNSISAIANSAKELQSFVENQPLESPFYAENKAIILQLFPKYIRTLSENLESPTFAPYQLWAEKYQLSADEIRTWKITFINRLFDNKEPTFQLWRDEQIKELQADNLTERRLRMAIWQKSDLNEWLTLLSTEGKAKAEWRYWAAKANKNQEQRKAVWEALSEERGFYPMLASQQLGKVYQLPAIAYSTLTQEQYSSYKTQFDRIRELRQLERFNQAKTVWIAFLKELSHTEKLAVIAYAKDQDWFDLAVEGTIQAKAFDYIDLRLPNAYSDWFDLNLKDKAISKTFAQAIARQESAWNAQAKSHANAMGLMQMLPTTAAKTAKDNNLPFRNESDLFRPFNNIMLGTTHLAELNEKYPNNRILIASAYNAGAGRVERWLARSQGTLEMDEFIASIPFYETRGYVQNVLAYDYYYHTLYANEHQKQTKELKMFYKEELTQKY
ncbi:transglycosylase SLT domain-containing protein [Mannheimia sp. AT1]|uniref:Transglycosylase SLT domain-containing protein n=1 Tax=Mannheimia cairinae TaxID=3025936 RepID=A0ABT5MS22_9PAST|nr:transglycosylase SLT domain-containing protein [Mannheimia cairinae]MDD0824840.1 transglycosylase SLT domain-containing protein [Mannheimia cairinae]MDD0826230.1 transglycosylase SLT domain-containing protein [Mannheimia cairinae]